MGTVLLAEDSRLGRFVALKTFTGDAAGTPQARQHLLDEARSAARLSHPNIAGVHDVLDIDGELVIVFEFVEGETLAARLRGGRLPVADAIRIAEQLADGLAAAHAQGVIHRDLKPANVMLTKEGRAKILDFGIARSIPVESVAGGASLHTTTGLFAGTPGYAAPEQWLGDPVGSATDIFALGAVLFEMLTGRRPFDASTRLALMQQVLDERRPHARELNDQVPPSIDALIDRALSRDPASRHGSAGEIATLLRSIDRDLPSELAAAAAAARPPRGRRWWLAAAAVLIAVLGGLVGSLRSPQPAVPGNVTPVVAVLPLVNATGSPANDYLAAGIADSLTTSLASLPGITVLSRAAVMGVWTRDKEPSHIARELGASYLIEGSVQRSGESLRLSVNLVLPDRSVAWGDSVEGLFDRVFELQSRLAASLGRALSVQLSAVDRARLAEQPTKNPQALDAYFRGRALLERRDLKGNVDAALTAFDEAVRLDSNFAIAHAARGEALWSRYVETRDPLVAQQAVSAGSTGLRLNPARPEVRYALAITLAGTGQPDAAVQELQHALALQPNYDDARRELGNVLAAQGRLEEAIAEFRKAISQRPNFSGHHSALGISLLQAARYKEAAQAFQRVIELQPDNYSGYSLLGTALQYMGRNEEAVAHYERATAIRPSAPVYSNLGALRHQRGEFAEAIKAYQAAIALRPNSAATHRNLGDAYKRLGRNADARQSYRDAVRLVEAELKVNPRNAVNLASAAVYSAKAGELGAARSWLKQAEALAPTDVQVLFRRGVVHALAGDDDAAIDALERAVAAGYSRTQIAEEEDFEGLRRLPRFQALAGRPAASGGSPR